MFEFAECLTRSARRVLPQITERGLAFTFDVDVSSLPVQGDVETAERALHRLLQGAWQFIDAGLLTIFGSANDQGMPTVRITGAGALVTRRRLASALDELALAPSGLSQAPLLIARGHCPVALGPVVLVHDPSEGFVLDATLPFAWTGAAPPLQPSAQGATAWVRLAQNPRSNVFRRRLQRLGWDVVLFDPDTALEDAVHRSSSQAPSLLLALERRPLLAEDVVNWLCLPLAGEAQRVLAVPLGHPVLERPEGVPFRLQALPFSPHDLACLTAAQEPAFDLSSLSSPLHTERPMLRLLIVDDNPVNQAVMGAMAEALGYSVLQAEDGQQAISVCLQTPPSAVLMDVNMPVMDGIEATRRMRALQRAGAMAPFPILGASADATPDNANACLAAGMDTFMAKPLMIAEVTAQLRRLSFDPPTGPNG